jgi:hypothetical protein
VVDRGQVAWSTVDRWWRRPKASEHGSALTGAWPPATLEHGIKLAGAQQREGTRGTRLGPHRGSNGGEVVGRWGETAAVIRARWGGSCELRSEQRRAGVSVVMAGGAPRPFIVAEEGHTGARKGETTDDNDLNAIEGGAA